VTGGLERHNPDLEDITIHESPHYYNTLALFLLPPLFAPKRDPTRAQRHAVSRDPRAKRTTVFAALSLVDARPSSLFERHRRQNVPPAAAPTLLPGLCAQPQPSEPLCDPCPVPGSSGAKWRERKRHKAGWEPLEGYSTPLRHSSFTHFAPYPLFFGPGLRLGPLPIPCSQPHRIEAP